MGTKFIPDFLFFFPSLSFFVFKKSFCQPTRVWQESLLVSPSAVLLFEDKCTLLSFPSTFGSWEENNNYSRKIDESSSTYCAVVARDRAHREEGNDSH